MAALTPEGVHDLTVIHRVGLSRYSTTVVRRILSLLNRTEESLVARLARTGNETIEGKRLEELLADLREIQKDGWKLVKARMGDEVADLAEAEIEFNEALLKATVDPEGVDPFSPRPGLSQVVAAAKARPFSGRHLKTWLSEAEEGAARLVRDTVRQGFVEGRTTDQVIRAIRGSRAAQYKDGILEISRRRAEAMVRTAMTHTANVSAQETYKAMGVERWRFVATLDSRVSEQCAALHGKTFPVGEGPQPPRHPNCRSTSIAVVDMIPGVKAFEFPSFNDWLTKQSAATQADILGVTKAKLFRTGSIRIDKFTDSAGRVLDLQALRKRNLEAFAAAGL
jgi:SPP1 gp7 family putative phage head morphogenesis protein